MASLHWLDIAFAVWLRVTVQLSLVVSVVLIARAALRARCTPGARYGLWLLLALPLIAPLLPAITLPIPAIFHSIPHSTAPTKSAPNALPPMQTGDWRVEYGPITATTPVGSSALATDAASRTTDWLRIGAAAWAIGASLLLVRVAFLHTRALRLARRAPVIEDKSTRSLLTECARLIGVRRPPRLIEVPAGTGPALLGVLRPMLLLPAGTTSSLSRDELRFVFLHELVHQKRGDVLAEWLLALVQIGQWFNPLILLAAARCRADREIACDARVLALTGDVDRGDYGRTILRLATELITSRPRLAVAAVGILENRTPLERRLRMIASTPNRKAARWPAAVVVFVTLALVTFSNAQAPKQSAPAKSDATAAGASTPAPIGAAPARASTDPGKANADSAGDRPTPREQTDPTSKASPEQLAALRKTLASAEEALIKKRIEYATRNDKARAYQELLQAEGAVTQLRLKIASTALEADKANDAALSAKLGRQVPEISFNGVALGDAIDFLRDVSGANIFVNWKALEAAGVGRNANVTARLKNVQFAKALQVILDSAAGNANKLSFKPDQGVITISTIDDLASPASTRVYDVRDLLVSVPNYLPGPPSDIEVQYDVASNAAPPAGKLEAEAEAARQKSVQAVIKLIQDTIEPQAWGKTAMLRELQGQLIVTAPVAVHESIVPLLQQLREGRAIQVTLEAKFISADETVLEALPQELRAIVAGELRAAKDPVLVAPGTAAKPAPATAPAANGGGEPAPKSAMLDDKQVEELMRAVQGDKKSSIISAPRMTLLNGQSAYVVTASQRVYAADYATVKLPDGGVKYEPVYGIVKSGITWWAQTTASADRKFVTLSMHPRLTHLEGMEEIPWDKSPPGEKLTVGKPKLLASELSATVSIPDGGTLLLGGLKAYLGDPGPQVIGKTATPVLMLVKAKLIVQKEIKQQEFPLLEKK